MHACLANKVYLIVMPLVFCVLYYFLSPATEEWIKFSHKYLEKWKERTINWVFDNVRHPVHVVRYEDLQRDAVGEVEKILDFLNFPYTHDDIIAKLGLDYTDFKRQHRQQDDFQYFTAEQKKDIEVYLSDMIDMAERKGKSHLFHFEEYLDVLENL